MYVDNIHTVSGDNVLTYEHIEKLRKEDSKLNVIAQKGCQEKFLASNADIVFIGGNRGGGKGSPYNSDVVTPFGLRKMGSLKVGDIITSIDGGMQKIICITELGNREVYKVNFSDGTSLRCTTDHVWKIKQTNRIHKSRYINGTGQDDDWRLWTFDMIKSHFDRQANKEISNGACKSNLLIPLCSPVKFTQGIGRRYKPKTSAYVIGALIGDGCLTEKACLNYSASITSMDNDIIKEFSLSGLEPCLVSGKKGCKAKTFFYKDDNLRQDLSGLKLYGCDSLSKFIPSYYKHGTVDERFDLIQGMMDTDGTVGKNGHCSYSTSSKRLAEDMAFVLRSLGAYVTISKKKTGYKDKNGIYKKCHDSYCLYIKMEKEERLFRLPRKKERCTPFNGGVSFPTKRITGYEFAGYEPCRCLLVSDPNALYLADDFIVTHNSFAILLEAIKDVQNKFFNSIILRNEKEDLKDLELTAYQIFDQFGTYNKSVSDMTWNFTNGGKLKFSYFSDTLEDFKTRFRGKQFSYIAIDEITQITYAKFKFLLTDNRNAAGIRNRLYGTCNPDPDSWVRKFIDWWIGEDGKPIEERDGVVRYCFMDGDAPESIYWGNTPQEVYEQCKGIIDPLWKPEYEKLGFNKVTMFVKSVTFIKGRLEENIKLISSSPEYLSNLAGQDEEQRSRDLEGNWNFKNYGDDLIKMTDMETFFNAAHQTDKKIRYVSADIAFEGGDFCVMWLWEDLHIKDMFVMRQNSASTETTFMAKLQEWGVREENVIYDYWGVGQALSGHIKRATKFLGTEKPKPPFDKSYKNVKSQCAEKLAHYIQDGKISIEPRLLELKFSGKKGKYQNTPLRQILMKERKCIRHKENSSIGGFELINKDGMIKAVGYSPDFFESLIYRMYFEIYKIHAKPKGLWML